MTPDQKKRINQKRRCVTCKKQRRVTEYDKGCKRCSGGHEMTNWRAEYGRLRAIAKQTRRGNGSRGFGEAIRRARARIKDELAELQQQLTAIDNLESMAKCPLAKLTKPLSPPDGYEPVAIFDGEEVSFCYEDRDGNILEMDWPFAARHVWPDDCEAVGIRVE